MNDELLYLTKAKVSLREMGKATELGIWLIRVVLIR